MCRQVCLDHSWGGRHTDGRQPPLLRVVQTCFTARLQHSWASTCASLTRCSLSMQKGASLTLMLSLHVAVEQGSPRGGLLPTQKAFPLLPSCAAPFPLASLTPGSHF